MSANDGESPLDPDEPHTPAWFTFLGLGLFLVGGIFVLATAEGEDDGAADSAAAAENAADEVAEAEGAAPEPKDEADPHAGHDHD